MTPPLDSFQTALLHRLREHVVTEPVAEQVAGARWTRPRVLLAAAAAAVAAPVVVLLVPGVGTSPAYSVQEGNAGEITVEVRRLEDAGELEEELARYGVAADVTYLPDRRQCAPGRYRPVSRSLSGMSTTMGSDLLSVTLPPGAVRDGETFVMAVSGETVGDDGFTGYADFDVTAGPVEPCREVEGAGDEWS